MTRRQKWGVATLGFTLILLSIILVAYALWPLPEVMEHVPLAPTLFAPP